MYNTIRPTLWRLITRLFPALFVQSHLSSSLGRILALKPIFALHSKPSALGQHTPPLGGCWWIKSQSLRLPDQNGKPPRR